MDVKIPDLGEDIEDAEILKVLVSEGDVVEKDQPVIELETDKASFELPSPEAGKITAILIGVGDTVKVGASALTLEPAGDGAAAGDHEPKKAKSKAAGEKPAARKSAAKPAARKGGEKKDEAKEPAARKSAPKPAAKSAHKEAGTGADWAAGPALRRLAREHGVDLASLEGSGAGGRITREDVLDRAAGAAGAAGGGGSAPARGADETPAPLPDFSKWGKVRRQRLSRLERVAAENLSRSWRTVPHVTQHDAADVTLLDGARRAYEKDREDGEPRITMTAFLIRASVDALKAFPRFNTSLDDASGELIFKSSIHVGVAVDTERGLLVPVIRDADARDLREIARDLDSLARRARDRKLSSEDMQGGTFTVTNLGGLGGTAFTPIVNHPEVAILGASRAQRATVTVDGAEQVRTRLPLSLSYDHRVINGADAVRFLRFVIGRLESPLRMMGAS